jgi:spore cortex biosynthesis protein YabQ
VNSAGQLETFILTMLTGILLGLLFDFYRILRGMLKPHWFFTSLGDLTYWLLATAIVFGILVFGNWGEIRLYVFFGLAAGMLSYYRLLSRKTIHLLVAAIRHAFQVFRAVKTLVRYTLITPARFLFMGFTKPVRYVSRKWKVRQSPPDNNFPPE